MAESKTTAAENKSFVANATKQNQEVKEQKKDISNASDPTVQQQENNKDIESFGKTSNAKDVTVKGLLEERTPEIYTLLGEIVEFKKLKSSLEHEIKSKQDLLKPVPRRMKKLKGQKASKINSEERKGFSLEVSLLQGQLLQVNEHLEYANDKLRSLSKTEEERLAMQSLRDKANSKAYTKRNKYYIKTNLLDLLNNILSGGDLLLKELFVNVRQAAFKPEGTEFNDLLTALLRVADPKVYILTSGKLKVELYEAVKLTLQHYNPRDLFIEKLIFPQDLVEEVILQEDPLIRNKALISRQMLNFLNGFFRDEDKLNKLKRLTNLSNERNKEELFVELGELICEESEDLCVLCTGEIKEKIYSLFMLNLQKWDLNSRFDEIIFT